MSLTQYAILHITAKTEEQVNNLLQSNNKSELRSGCFDFFIASTMNFTQKFKGKYYWG
jgi:hypothetical protein